jgi:hypothetical protein
VKGVNETIREGFVRETKERLRARAMWQEVVGTDGPYELQENESIATV